MAYNGWSNYETWCAALWLDNDEDTYHEVQRMARHTRDTSALAAELKEMVTDAAPDLGASMYADLLGAALGEVDWYEMAEHYIADNDADDEPDTDATKEIR